MTRPRSQLIAPGSGGTFHCVQRCVRRAFLCGHDVVSGQSFEHRKPWVVQRLQLLGECFAVAIHAYAMMSNHLHVVVQIDPAWLMECSDTAIATRWVRLFPPRDDSDAARNAKRDRLLLRPERLTVIRRRLADLSWFMKCLAEPIARAANAEDGCKGRFWEGRFKAQKLADERALLAAMAYVDLNPIRAGMADRLEKSEHTSIQRRLRDMSADDLERPLHALVGYQAAVPALSQRAYVELVEWTGRQVRPDKRGALSDTAPSALARFATDPGLWTLRVRGIGSGYWRVVADAAEMIEAAAQMGQRWLKGIGLARRLESAG